MFLTDKNATFRGLCTKRHWFLLVAPVDTLGTDFKKETEHLRVEAGRKGVQMRAQYGCYVFAGGCCMTQIRPQRHLRGLPLLLSYSYIDGLAASEGDFEPTMIYD